MSDQDSGLPRLPRRLLGVRRASAHEAIAAAQRRARKLTDEVADLEGQIAEQAEALAELRGQERLIAATLLRAQAASEELLADAEAEAEARRSDAEAEAEARVAEADDEVDRLRQEARSLRLAIRDDMLRVLSAMGGDPDLPALALERQDYEEHGSPEPPGEADREMAADRDGPPPPPTSAEAPAGHEDGTAASGDTPEARFGRPAGQTVEVVVGSLASATAVADVERRLAALDNVAAVDITEMARDEVTFTVRLDEGSLDVAALLTGDDHVVSASRDRVELRLAPVAP